jgi:putative ABC transport system permease protein
VKGAGAVWALAGKGLWAHKVRLTLSVLAVVLGVAFIAGTLLLTDSLRPARSWVGCSSSP